MTLYPPDINVVSGLGTPYRALTFTNEFGASLVADGVTADANGTTWQVSKMDGWEGGPSRIVSAPIPGVDGVYQAAGYYDAKTITIDGHCWSLTDSLAQAAADTLAYATAATRNLGLLRAVDLSGTDRLLAVRRDGAIKWNATHTIVEWEAIFTAPDPVRYSTAAGTTLFDSAHRTPTPNNNGTYPSSNMAWTATVTDPTVTALQIENFSPVYAGGPALFLKWNFTFVAGDQIVVAWYPPHSMYVLRSGSLIDLRPVLTSDSQWWPLSIGVNSLTLNTGSGTGISSGTLTWFSAWV